MDPPERPVSTLPNILSVSRILIAPLIFFAVKENATLIISLLAAWAILSDFFDGFLARKLSSISMAGKIFDPLADKLCVAAAAVSITLYGAMPVILLLLILARDLFIAVFGIIIIKKRKMVPISNIFGKVTVFVLAICLLAYVYRFESFYDLAFWLAVVFIMLSSIAYLHFGWQMISAKNLNNFAI